MMTFLSILENYKILYPVYAFYYIFISDDDVHYIIFESNYLSLLETKI